MDYEKIYADFYSKYYNKAEFLIKKFLMKRESENKTFGFSLNEVKIYMETKLPNSQYFIGNKNLNELYDLFNKKNSIYKIENQMDIFSNELRKGFQNIETFKLPNDYSYPKFIKEIAIVEVVKEIFRLLCNNDRLLILFYELNNFDDFEIREHRGISIEDYPAFKKLIVLKHPEYYNPHSDDEIFEQYEEVDLSNSSATEKIIFLQKLGVIDFLRTKQPFISSINSLATVLSAVTGEKSGTVQPMLNAMLSKNVDTRNNPLESKKPVNKVTQQLIKIGFNLNETI